MKRALVVAGLVTAAAVGGNAAFPEKHLAHLDGAGCVIPDCRTLLGRGEWDDAAEVDCLATGPLGLPDGGPRWRGCNVMPASLAVGGECLPVTCEPVTAGVNPTELR